MNKLYFILLLLVVACGSNETNEEESTNNEPTALVDCTLVPSPYFSDTIAQIITHKSQFSADSTLFVEDVTFDNDLKLSITQSGCDEKKHELQFYVPGKWENSEDQFWIDQAKKLLIYIGSLDEQLEPMMKVVVNDMNGVGEGFVMGEPMEMTGYSIEVDKILSEDHALVPINLVLHAIQ